MMIMVRTINATAVFLYSILTIVTPTSKTPRKPMLAAPRGLFWYPTQCVCSRRDRLLSVSYSRELEMCWSAGVRNMDITTATTIHSTPGTHRSRKCLCILNLCISTSNDRMRRKGTYMLEYTVAFRPSGDSPQWWVAPCTGFGNMCSMPDTNLHSEH